MPFMLTTGKFFRSVVGIKGMNFLPLRQRQQYVLLYLKPVFLLEKTIIILGS